MKLDLFVQLIFTVSTSVVIVTKPYKQKITADKSFFENPHLLLAKQTISSQNICVQRKAVHETPSDGCNNHRATKHYTYIKWPWNTVHWTKNSCLEFSSFCAPQKMIKTCLKQHSVNNDTILIFKRTAVLRVHRSSALQYPGTAVHKNSPVIKRLCKC